MSGDRLHPMTRRQLRLCIGVTGPIPAKSSGKTSTATASLGSRQHLHGFRLMRGGGMLGGAPML
jgi:hypothetical protein